MVVTVYKKTFRGFSISCHFEKGAWWATAHTTNDKRLARRSKAVFRSCKEEALFGAEYLVLKRECKLSEKPQVLMIDSNLIYKNKTARRLRSVPCGSEAEVERELVETSCAPIEVVTLQAQEL
ncbi:MAG: hypothetical protein BRC41_19225 [Cyanobacteria bacterium QH_9_48_43]|nr:MAG: hypothetical protein BRC41_19225 [Cyanobacteria bacterium QH_9_48_43]